jgi:hypothetical protein
MGGGTVKTVPYRNMGASPTVKTVPKYKNIRNISASLLTFANVKRLALIN